MINYELQRIKLNREDIIPNWRKKQRKKLAWNVMRAYKYAHIYAISYKRIHQHTIVKFYTDLRKDLA